MAGRTPAKQPFARTANGCRPRSGVCSRGCPSGTSTALCTCAIRDCSGLVWVQGKARCEGNGPSPWQAPQRSPGRTPAHPKGDTRLSRPGVAPLAKAMSLPCATRLVAKQPGVAAAANGTGAECCGGAFLSPVSLRTQRNRHGRVTQVGSKLQTLIRARHGPQRQQWAQLPPHTPNHAQKRPPQPESPPPSQTQY